MEKYHSITRFLGNEDLYDENNVKVGWKEKHETVYYKMSNKVETVYRFLKRYHAERAKYLLSTYPFIGNDLQTFGIYVRDNKDGTISMISKCAHGLSYTDFNYTWKFQTRKQRKFAMSEILRIVDVINDI